MRRRAALLLAGSLLAAAPAGAIELEGTWYVLVHFQDKESPKPDAWRWEDRVWKFERKADRLEWTDYPIVVFDDEKGRFDSLGSNHAARVVEAWEPSAAQLADIKDGLQVNPRGVKTKSLRAVDGGAGWSSSEGASGASATVITYTEHWSIAGLPDKPVFTRDDSMSGGSTEELSGRTQYKTTEATADELHGSFDRDGTRIGNFRMIRSGDTQKVRGSGLTQDQRVMQMFASQAGLTLDAAQIQAITSGKVAPGSPVPDDVRADVRAQIRQGVEEAFRRQSTDPRAASAEVDRLTSKIEHLILDEGKSPEQVQEMLKRGEVTP